MSRLFPPPTFTTFGPNYLATSSAAPRLHQVFGSRPSHLGARVREECPLRPGVYGMVDRHGELIYVGKAKRLRVRLLSYFRTRGRDPKAGRILRHAASIVWETCPSEFAALHRELELIRRWRPRFNVHGQPSGWRYAHVCLGRHPAPYVFLAARPPARALASFGPIPAGTNAQEAVRRLNDWFRLRDCPQAQEMVFAEQAELFPVLRAPGCLRHEIGTCLGPCVAACSQQEYAARVAAARAFLAGDDLAPLAELREQRDAASAGLAYERAAVLRDRLEQLTWLHEQLDALRQAQQNGSFVYPVAGQDGARVWYLVHGGRTVKALPAPQDAESRRLARDVLQRLYPAGGAAARPGPDTRVEGVLLVASWFRCHPEERGKVLRPEQALALLQE